MRLLKSGEFTCSPGRADHVPLSAAGDARRERSEDCRICGSACRLAPSCRRRSTANSRNVSAFTLLDGYGITETSTMVTMNWPTGERVLGSCGVPVPGLAVRIVDPATAATSILARRRIDRSRPQRHAWLSQQAGGNREARCATAGITPAISPRATKRLSHHHRAAEGAHHPRRPEHRARRDRGSREYVRSRARLRRGRHCRTSIWARCRRFSWCRVPAARRKRSVTRRIAENICRPTRCRTSCADREIPRTGSGKIIRYKLRELIKA